MAPYLKADTRLWGRSTVGRGCRAVDELSEMTRQPGRAVRNNVLSFSAQSGIDSTCGLKSDIGGELARELLRSGDFLFDTMFDELCQVKLIAVCSPMPRFRV